MTDHGITRRKFVRDTVAAAAAAGLTATYAVHAGNPDKADTDKIVNYNPDMEYRRCGRTGLMISAVCLGGHWKRMDAIVPGVSFRASNRSTTLPWLSSYAGNWTWLKRPSWSRPCSAPGPICQTSINGYEIGSMCRRRKSRLSFLGRLPLVAVLDE